MNVSTKETSRSEKIFIAVMSILVAYIIFVLATKPAVVSKANAETEGDSAESYLLLNDAFDAVYSNVASIVPASQSKSRPGPDFLLSANDTLLGDLKEDPHNPAILTKLIIVRIEKRLPAQKYFDELTKLSGEEAQKDALALESAYAFRPPKGSDSKPGSPVLAPHQSESGARSLSALPKGWYEKHARYVLEMRTGKKREAEKTLQSLDDEAVSYAIKFALLRILGTLVGLVGVITILVQLFFLARRITPLQDMPLLIAPVDYGWLTVYKVFLYWILTTIAISMLLELIAPKQSGNPEAVALFNLFAYLVAYSPGVYIIYHFALKPYGIKFGEGIKLKMRAGKLGPIRMILAGVLAWTAAVPVVLLAGAIAQRFLHSHGSDNEIKDKILEAAATGDPIVLGSYFLMAGILAPIIEESLFRGFLYTYLRRRLPVFPSIVATALLFSAVHVDPGGFLPLFCLGAVFAFTLEKTKSIVPTIIAHSLWNSVSFAFALLSAG